MITRQQVLDLFQSDDLIGIALEAEAVRRRLHPERIVTYFMDDGSDSRPPRIAPIAFAAAETAGQHVDRLETIYALQAQREAFTAVLPSIDGTAAEYLKMLAISRIYLDNIPHMQTSWESGLKVCQIALRFGADDISCPGNSQHRPAEEQLRCLIRDAGFIPKQRDALFQTYFLD